MESKNNDIVLSLENVSKTFYSKQDAAASIRDFTFGLFSRRKEIKVVKALQNINLEIRKGETFGIIGSNGSGKSTLIHLMMKSMKPDKGGIVETKGVMLRLALGMGMDPNLSARENIYVNGSILGLSFSHIGTIFNEIIAYANLEDFVDTPVKHFSKGMHARLKFSIALHANAEILLLDEFFGGVGDQDFRKKSTRAFKQVILEGKTIIMVSHAVQNVKKHCERALWLDKGIVKMLGSADEVVDAYIENFKQLEAKKEREAKELKEKKRVRRRKRNEE